jgi:Uma2 family endonuclease
MPTLLTEALEPPPTQFPPRKRWTREQCAPLEAAGLFEKERLELVDGELISKMGKNRPHVNAFSPLHFWLLQIFGVQFVNVEAPIDVRPEDNPTNEPVPDIIVLNRKSSSLTSGNPQPKDISLLVEVSDTTLDYDRTVKAPLYARAGIVEYWILDVASRRLLVHRDPANGRYNSILIYAEHESIAPLAAPHAEFSPTIAFAE